MVKQEQSVNRPERFDALAPDYDRHTLPFEWLLLRRLRRRLLQDAAGTVLEIGVGTGANFPFYPEGVTLFGVDLAPQMLARAQARADRLRKTAHLNLMDAAQLIFPDHSFDTVISTLSLCSLEHPRRTLNEMTRVVRPSGQLLFVEHGRSRLALINRWLDRATPRHLEAFGCCPNLDMEQLLRSMPLRVERVESHLWGIIKAFWARPVSPTL